MWSTTRPQSRSRMLVVRRQALGPLDIEDHIDDGDPNLIIDGERFWVRLWDDQRAKSFLRHCRDDH